MKSFIALILLILIPSVMMSQKSSLSHQYQFDALAINPAFAGCHDALSVSLYYKNQWIGFKDAPKSYTFSIHSSINNDRVGLGLLVTRNSIGIYKETNILSNYAYRMELFNGKLAMGIGLGVTVCNFAWNDLVITDPSDPQLLNNPISATLPAISMGTYYYTRKYFVGFSLPLFLSHEMESNTGNLAVKNDFSKYNYLITGGYNIEFNNQITLQPSLLINYQPSNSNQIDLNAQLNLKERIWVGMSYRTTKKLIGNLQCQLNYQIRMAYSYVFDLGRIGNYTNGSHEISINYQFRYKLNVMGPKQF